VVGDPFSDAESAAAQLASRTGRDRHDVAIVLGSGWLPAAEELCPRPDAVDLAVTELVGFPAPTVPGHAGRVRSGQLGRQHVLVWVGRAHLYEGHSPATVVHAVRTAVFAGCRTVVLTNAAGALDRAYRIGHPVLIRDHLNLTAASPLTGSRPPLTEARRFVDLTDLYSPRLRALAQHENPALTEGVYAGLPGPQYETPAEVTMLRALGADLVGMSTVLEAIAARHLGAEVLGLSLVTNLAAGLQDEPISHEEVLAAGAAAADRVGALLAALVGRIP
jgi:purine-nucleoside phosphorylase